ncbi:MAG: CapA family protein [Clostridia bacterium]|nr:CapA family protein [Clostridia bacterium]
MKFTAAGDIIIQRRIAENYKGYEELRSFIERGDARFFNLETTLNEEGECFASQFSGGTYIRTTPKVLGDLKKMGFNMTSFNNNHALDFSYEGFLRTLDAVEDSGFIHAGCGRNLAEAAAPKFLETENGRVALIAVNTSFNPACMAGEQTKRIPGRPGINGLRLKEHFEVTEEEFSFIKQLAESTGVNVARTITAKEGYAPLPKENEAMFGELKFIKSNRTKWVRKIIDADLERVRKAIEEAKWQSDEVIISVHSHQLDGTKKEDVSEFLTEFAHFCIDNGANAVIGHGPHLLRAIEVYKESPIFYSLGDFVLQLYNIEFAPMEFYEKYSLTPENTVYELLKKRSKNFTVGLMEDKKMFETVIPYWETENGKLKRLELLPVMIAMEGNQSEIGLPRLAKDDSFINRLAEISAPYGVTMKKENGVYVCEW